MSARKLVTNLNRIMLVLTVVLYLTLIYGMLAQILLGFFQLMVAIVLGMRWFRLTESNKKKLSYYWCSVVLYFLLWFTPVFQFTTFSWLVISIIPMIIAGYFTYFLESFVAKRKSVFSLR